MCGQHSVVFCFVFVKGRRYVYACVTCFAEDGEASSMVVWIVVAVIVTIVIVSVLFGVILFSKCRRRNSQRL